jgi:hypothetical protein
MNLCVGKSIQRNCKSDPDRILIHWLICHALKTRIHKFEKKFAICTKKMMKQ